MTLAIVDHWLMRKAPPHALALFRICFGLWLLLRWGLEFPHVPQLFSSEGYVFPLLFDVPVALHPLFVPPPASVTWLLYGFLMGSFVMITVGFLMRPAAMIAFLLSLYFWFLELHLLGASFDRLFIFFLLVLAFSGADGTYSLVMRIRKGSWTAWEPVSVLPQRLLALQMTATYLGVGWQKMILPDWQSGEILRQSLTGRWATPPAFALARVLPAWIYEPGVFFVKFFEALLPFGLWIKKVRWIFVVGLAIFLGSIAALMQIWWFLILVPGAILFWGPEEVERLLRSPSIARRKSGLTVR